MAVIGVSASSYLYYNSDAIQSGQIQLVDKDPTLQAFTTYEDERSGVKIDYPEEWTVKSDGPKASVQFVPYDVPAEDMWQNPLFAITAAPIDRHNQNASE